MGSLKRIESIVPVVWPAIANIYIKKIYNYTNIQKYKYTNIQIYIYISEELYIRRLNA